MHKVAILVHRYDSFQNMDYWLRAIAEDWRESGIEIELLYGPQARADADLAILHVNLTVIPVKYMDHVSRYPRVINASVRDISKRRISSHLLRPGDRHDGPVIVKTDRNALGVAEWRIAKGGLLHPRAHDLMGNYTDFAKEAYRIAR